jgi:hypothetical protein
MTPRHSGDLSLGDRPNCIRRSLAIWNLSFSISRVRSRTENCAAFNSAWQASANARSASGSEGRSAVASDMTDPSKYEDSGPQSGANRCHVRPALAGPARAVLRFCANPSPRAAAPIAPASASCRRRRSAATRTCPSPVVREERAREVI